MADTSKSDKRAQKLAAKLKENLRRRKAQQRARGSNNDGIEEKTREKFTPASDTQRPD